MTVMDPVTVPIQVIPTTLSKINTGLQFITLVVGIVAVPLPVADTTALTTMVTSAIEMIAESYPTYLEDGTRSTIDTTNWYDKLFLVQRMYITDHILPPLCWITGATTIASSLSYYGHSAFISTKQSIPNPSTDSHKAK